MNDWEISVNKRRAFGAQLQLKLREGKALSKAGDYAAALKIFLYVEKNAYLGLTMGLQHRTVVACISNLAKDYPPALKSLKRCRDKKEKRILENNKNDSIIYSEWLSINYLLEGDDYSLNFLELAELEAEIHKKLLRKTIDQTWQRFVRKKRYSELWNYFEKLGSDWIESVAEYETHLMFPTLEATEKQKQKWLEWNKKQLVKEGLALRQLSLGLEKNESAAGIEKVLKRIATDLVQRQ